MVEPGKSRRPAELPFPTSRRSGWIPGSHVLDDLGQRELQDALVEAIVRSTSELSKGGVVMPRALLDGRSALM